MAGFIVGSRDSGAELEVSSEQRKRITKSLQCSWGSSQFRNVCYAHQGQRAAIYIHVGRDAYLPN